MRRAVLSVSLALVCAASGAQQPSEAEMQRMMEQAQKMQQQMQGMDPAALEALQGQAAEMQACMENVDQAALEQMRREGETVEREVRALCSAGKRDAASARAMDYAKQVAASPEIAQIRECSAALRGMLPALSTLATTQPEPGASHVCDSPGLR